MKTRIRNALLTIALIMIMVLLASAGISRLADVVVATAEIKAELERDPRGVVDIIAMNRESEISLIEARGRSPLILLFPAALLIVAFAIVGFVVAAPFLKELRLLLKQMKGQKRSSWPRQAPVYRPPAISRPPTVNRPALPDGREEPEDAPWLD